MKRLTLMFLLAAGAAQARPDPTPPPSGIVIHLFGPDSITSHVLPTGPSAPPAVRAPASSAPQGTSQTATEAAPGAPQPAAPAAQPYPEPSMGDILHQMFVTGDPNLTPAMRRATGKAGQ